MDRQRFLKKLGRKLEKPLSEMAPLQYFCTSEGTVWDGVQQIEKGFFVALVFFSFWALPSPEHD